MNFLQCYGEDIETLANEAAGDFDLRSPTDGRSWYRQRWEAIAETLGFQQSLAAELDHRRGAPQWLAAIAEAGMAAFMTRMQYARPALTDPHADLQTQVLEQLIASGQRSGALWRVTADPHTLAAGVCYADESGNRLRAFSADTGPGYFSDGWTGPTPRAEQDCGWDTPLTLYLGTFPWVYSTRMDAAGPGLRWLSRRHAPAITAFRVATSLLQPEINLRQDASEVVVIYRHFAAHTAPLLAQLPDVTGRHVGDLYRRGGLLQVHQGSLHVTGLAGPRGYLPAPAYNYIIRSFASFFAVRRATLRALPWSAALAELAATSQDRCLRTQIEEMSHA